MVWALTTVATVAQQNLIGLHVIGDSTACAYGADRAPRAGWAQCLQPYFDADRVMVVNGARSGRSSKSFYEESIWARVVGRVRVGDYVLIQFGHNDAKDDPDRHTDPDTTYKAYLTKYVEETRARGATPILLTPIPRNAWNGAKMKDTHGGYQAAMKSLAAERDVPLIDMNARVTEWLEKLGPDQMATTFLILEPGAFPNYPDGVVDNTHLQERGARHVAGIVAAEIQTLGLPLSTYVRSAVSESDRRPRGPQSLRPLDGATRSASERE